jgi:SAM-dependent methyltransferase
MPASRALIWLFTLAIFIAAFLLFLIQPMFAKLLLPKLGGSPAVWNTAMVFYQAALLAGYGYAHLATRRGRARQQAALHGLLVLAPLFLLPVTLPPGAAPPPEGHPIPWLLGVMAVSVGLPFAVVATTSPLLQRWLAATGHPAAKDPYFLYAASNAGSLLALLAYPLLIEPNLTLAEQSALWTRGYWALAALLLACAGVRWQARPEPESHAAVFPPGTTSAADAPPPAARQRLRWVVLALVPASLMLSVTNHISYDIASVPLFWVVPLGLYLLTFIVVFARRQWVSAATWRGLLPIAVMPLVMMMAMSVARPVELLIALHLGAFTIAALACHATLAAERPGAERLTEFYLWMSAGGVLGGCFNAILAPLLFNSFVEYPLALLAACWLALPKTPALDESRARLLDFALPAGVAVLTLALVKFLEHVVTVNDVRFYAIAFGVPGLLCFAFLGRPLRFALGLAAVLWMGAAVPHQEGRVVHSARSFFGVHRVTRDDERGWIQLVHGRTLHGSQSLDPARRRSGMGYYDATGPIGQFFAAWSRRIDKPVAVFGLGAGALAVYCQPGQNWTFYEIDPLVKRIAEDERFFTYLRDAAGKIDIVLGDARLKVAEAPDAHYGIIIQDAYSSDALPVHLATREALQLYLRKLSPGGVLLFHISNRHLDLESVLANLAAEAGLAALVQYDYDLTEEEHEAGKFGSVWFAMARKLDEFGPLLNEPRWLREPVASSPVIWTDDYSSILHIWNTP